MTSRFDKPTKEYALQHWSAPSSFCWSCGTELNRHCGPCDPVPGDVTLCVSCTAILIFAEGGRLREPTADELATYSLDDTVRSMTASIQAANRRARQEE